MPGGETAAQAIQVITESRNLRTQPFIIPDETNSVGKAWEEWLEGIERELRYLRIRAAVDKRVAIIIHGGKEIGLLEKSLPDPELEDVYLKLLTKLNDHFTSCEVFIFKKYLTMNQLPGALLWWCNRNQSLQDCHRTRWSHT